MAEVVLNKITINADDEQVQKILNAVRRDGDVYGSFDLNKLIPMPDCMDLPDGSITNAAIIAFLSTASAQVFQSSDPSLRSEFTAYIAAAQKIPFCYADRRESEDWIKEMAEHYEKSVPEFIALGKQYLNNQRQYGAHSWHPWCFKNWGTKWNTQEGSVLTGKKELSFESAYKPPVPVLKELSRRFPSVALTHKWASEDFGYNVGMYVYQGGKITGEHVPQGGSKEAFEMSFSLLNVQPADVRYRFDLKMGTYVYDDKLAEQAPQRKQNLDNLIDFASAKAASTTAAEKQPQEKDPER